MPQVPNTLRRVGCMLVNNEWCSMFACDDYGDVIVETKDTFLLISDFTASDNMETVVDFSHFVQLLEEMRSGKSNRIADNLPLDPSTVCGGVRHKNRSWTLFTVDSLGRYTYRNVKLDGTLTHPTETNIMQEVDVVDYM